MSGGRWEGSVPRVPQRAGVSTTHDDRTPSALGSGSGTCVRGFARQGSGVLAGGSPTFGFSQGRQVMLESPAPVPRAGRQVPGGRKPRAGGLPRTARAPATGGNRPHPRDQRPWRPEGVSSALRVCARVTLRAASRPLDSPSSALPGTTQTAAPHGARRMPLAPGCPTPPPMGRFL